MINAVMMAVMTIVVTITKIKVNRRTQWCSDNAFTGGSSNGESSGGGSSGGGGNGSERDMESLMTRKRQGFGDITGKVWNSIRQGAKARRLAFTITAEEAWRLFGVQAGRCALTGWPLDLDPNNRTASLDRIDSAEGYVLGNLQWVHRDINKLKSDFPRGYFIYLCRAVAQHQPRSRLSWIAG